MTQWSPGGISSRGQYLDEFENQLAAFTGARYAISVCNGTAALHLALKGLGIGAGDEVIVPDLTFAASASAVIHAGAEPVLVGVTADKWILDPESVEAALSPKTKAIMPVHLFGLPADMTVVNEIARANDLFVVEDAAEALGASWKGMSVGALGTAGCFSFYANKTVTTGEGGAIVTNDPILAQNYRILRDHGMSPERRYWHETPGFNFRLTNLQAAVGVAQMEKIEQILERKRLIFERYVRAFKDRSNLKIQAMWPHSKSGMWAFCLDLGGHRDSVAKALVRQGIETRNCFTALHQMPAFSDFRTVGDLSVGMNLGSNGLILPSGATLGAEDQDSVVETVLHTVNMIQEGTPMSCDEVG